MRVACVWLPHFPIVIERRNSPALNRRGVIIGETTEQRGAVLDCSTEAEGQGVRVGMPLRQALGLCPRCRDGTGGLAVQDRRRGLRLTSGCGWDVVYIGSYDGHVYALDAAAGEEGWRLKTGGAVYGSPAVVGGMVYIGSSDGHVYAVTEG